MITESDIVCLISCPKPPEYSGAVFQLSYSAKYKEDGQVRHDTFEKIFEMRKDSVLSVRFSDGSIVRFGHLPLFLGWTNAVKRKLSDYEVESYWGFQVCDVMPTMGYSTGFAKPHHLCDAFTHEPYRGNELRLTFEDLLTAIHVSRGYFGRAEGFSTYEIRRSVL